MPIGTAVRGQPALAVPGTGTQTPGLIRRMIRPNYVRFKLRRVGRGLIGSEGEENQPDQEAAHMRLPGHARVRQPQRLRENP